MFTSVGEFFEGRKLEITVKLTLINRFFVGIDRMSVYILPNNKHKE